MPFDALTYLTLGGENKTIEYQEVTVGPNSIISIANAAPLSAKDVTIAIEPVQDLHGYDSPWPAGGGKNMCPPPIVGWSYQPTTGEPMTSQIAAGTEKILVDFSLNPNYTVFTNIPVNYMVLAWDNNGDLVGRTTGALRNDSPLVISKTSFSSGSGGNRDYDNIASIGVRLYEGSDQNIQDVNNGFIQIEVGDTYTGYEPYSNICPITGWTGAKVTKRGKNLFDMETSVSGFITGGGNTITRADAENRTSDFIPVIAGQTYTYSAFPSEEGNGYWTGYSFYREKNLKSVSEQRRIVNTGASALTIPITIPEGINYLRIGSRYLEKGKAQLELGSTATAYEPYRGGTYDITFPTEAGTVYGGTLDLTVGKLVVDRAMVDMGMFTFYLSSVKSSIGGNAFTINVSTLGMAGRERYTPNQVLSSRFATAPKDRWYIDNMLDNEMFVNKTNLYISASQYDTASDFKTAMSGVQLVYELATPITYDLTPQEIAMFRGANTLWADTGDATLVYGVRVESGEGLNNIVTAHVLRDKKIEDILMMKQLKNSNSNT